MHKTMLVAGLMATGLLAAACGGGSGNGTKSGSGSGYGAASSASSAPAAPYGAPSSAAAAPGSATAAATVASKKINLGSIVVDQKGMTLYLFEKDKGGKSACYGGCATAWPPLLTTGNAMPGSGVKGSLLGTTKRTDGKTQVTYNGWPLYYFVGDKAPGDITGQNLDQFGAEWYVVGAATGKKLEK